MNKLMCPRCKSKDLVTARLVVIKDSDNVMCKSCNYSQKAKIFKDTWRIDKANK
jgi:transcription elongation factor Elf1